MNISLLESEACNINQPGIRFYKYNLWLNKDCFFLKKKREAAEAEKHWQGGMFLVSEGHQTNSFVSTWCVCIRGCADAFRRGRMHVRMFPASHVFFPSIKCNHYFFMENDKQVLLHFFPNLKQKVINDEFIVFYVIQCGPSNSFQVPFR